MKTPTVGGPGLNRRSDIPPAAPGFEDALRAAGVTRPEKPTKPGKLEESGDPVPPPPPPPPPPQDPGPL